MAFRCSLLSTLRAKAGCARLCTSALVAIRKEPLEIWRTNMERLTKRLGSWIATILAWWACAALGLAIVAVLLARLD